MKKQLFVAGFVLLSSCFMAPQAFALVNNVREGGNLIHDLRVADVYTFEIGQLPTQKLKNVSKYAEKLGSKLIVKYDNNKGTRSFLNGGRYGLSSEYVANPASILEMRSKISDRNAVHFIEPLDDATSRTLLDK